METWTRDLATMREAEEYLRDRGFSIGRLQGPAPRGIMLGDIDIQKWRNLDQRAQAELHGVMTRHGDVPPYGERARVTIRAGAPAEAHAAIRLPSKVPEPPAARVA